jgi:hypothetical protein
MGAMAHSFLGWAFCGSCVSAALVSTWALIQSDDWHQERIVRRAEFDRQNPHFLTALAWVGLFVFISMALICLTGKQ